MNQFIFIAILFLSNNLYAQQAGALDLDFSGDGKVITPFSSTIEGGKVAIQPDGKIVVAGSRNYSTTIPLPLGGTITTYYFDIVITRYYQNGSLDNSFGSSGIKIINIESSQAGVTGELKNIVLQPDGKILLVGKGAISFLNFLIRLNPNGSFDNTFDGDGRLHLPSINSNAIGDLNDVIVQPNGKIVAVGKGGATNDMCIIRVNNDGTLDLGFDGDGLKLVNNGGNETATSVALQADNKIVVVGSNNSDILTCRLTTSGVLDTSFDTDGIQTTNIRTNDYAYAIIIQPDGKILVGGETSNTSTDRDFCFVRYNTNGSLDLSFTSLGYSIHNINGIDSFEDMILQADGKIIAVGHSTISGSNITDFSLMRLNMGTSVSFDASFDLDGKVLTAFNTNDSYGSSVAMQADGKILVAGSNSTNLLLARYHAATTFNENNGKVYANIGTSEDIANALTIRPNGKILTGGYTQNGAHKDFALAQFNSDGSLDYTFGNNAKIISSFLANTDETIRALAIQSDGKILAAGTIGTGTAANFIVARYLADGSGLDMSFGTNGYMNVDINVTDELTCIVLQPDGKIVAGGASNNDFALIRLNTNGTLDPTFGTGGRVTTNMGDVDKITAIALQADGKIVVVGSVNSFTPFAYTIGLALYNPDGSLDNAFDGDGKRTLNVGVGTVDTPTCIVIQPDGKFLVGMTTGVGSATSDIGVMRFNTNGSTDATFGSGGVALIDFNGIDICRGIAIHPNGKIVVVGAANISTMAFARLNSNGTIDTSFDNDGKFTLDLGYDIDQLNAMALQADGKMLGVGYYNNGTNSDFALVRVNGVSDFSYSNGKTFTEFGTSSSFAETLLEQPDGKMILVGRIRPSHSFALARYLNDGSLDNTFGINGTVTTPMEGLSAALGFYSALQPDGKIVVGGTVNGASLVRYNADGTLDNTFGTSGRVKTTSSSGVINIFALTLQPDGKILVGGVLVYNANSEVDCILIRYNTNGTLDNTFNGTGIATISTNAGATSYEDITGIVVQADGKIVTNGSITDGSNYDFLALRFNSNGTLDNTFDADGSRIINIGVGNDVGSVIALQPDGKMVLVGSSSNGTNDDFAIVRLNTDGSFDNTFDADGKLTLPIFAGSDIADAVRILPDGKILIGGRATNNNLDRDMALVRLLSNGSLDNTFDSDGKYTTNIGSSGDFCRSIIYQPATKNIFIGGYYTSASNSTGTTKSDFALVKLQPCTTETLILVNASDNYPNAALPNPQIGKIITATNRINPTANVTYRSSSSITFEPGFQANIGAVFRTEISGCTY
jgi:uncharacterized delta-60 repeat protein